MAEESSLTYLATTCGASRASSETKDDLRRGARASSENGSAGAPWPRPGAPHTGSRLDIESRCEPLSRVARYRVTHTSPRVTPATSGARPGRLSSETLAGAPDGPTVSAGARRRRAVTHRPRALTHVCSSQPAGLVKFPQQPVSCRFLHVQLEISTRRRRKCSSFPNRAGALIHQS